MNNKRDLSRIHFILDSKDLSKSKMFYSLLFDTQPIVEDNNIVEFEIVPGFILGLQSIELKDKLFDRDIFNRYRNTSNAASELYIECENAEAMHQKALSLGCLELSPFSKREWDHYAGYSINHDGHILAYAKPSA